MKINNLCIDIEILKDHKVQFANNQKKNHSFQFVFSYEKFQSQN